jgi:hypothetical protein
MSLIVQPDTLASILADVERRLEALERSPGIRDSVVALDAQAPPVTRVGIGQLDTIFPSAGYAAGTYGMRVQDASGNSILDSIGLQQIMQRVGRAWAPSGGPARAYTASFLDMPETLTNTFTLSRSTRVYVTSAISFYTSGGTANYGQVKLVLRASSSGGGVGGFNDLDGLITEGAAWVVGTNGAGMVNGAPYIVAHLAAGTYVALMEYQMQGGATTTLTNYNSQVDAWQLGA